MASFIAKQMLGSQLDAVKGAVGDDKKDEGGKKEVDPELEEALREAEEKRQEKHRKMEEERETMRQGIRDKYGLKKKEEEVDVMAAMQGGSSLGRARKTPAEMEAERLAAEEEEGSLVNMLPENMRGVAKSAMEAPTKLVADAQEKCLLM